MSKTFRSPTFARRFTALVLFSAFVAGTAAAQTRSEPLPSRPAVEAGSVGKSAANTITYKQRTSYDFDDDQVEGTLVQPDTDLVTGRQRAHHDSLVRLRTTFQPEMLKSVESL